METACQPVPETILCRAYDLGLVEYPEALKLQERLVERRIARSLPDTILFIQHPHVITVGASGGEQNIIVSRDTLAGEGVAVLRTDRGGNITYHGPGQLVGYPIFDLDTMGRDVHRYVRNLEEVIIRTLGDFSIMARRIAGYTGVWVGEEKICAIGIRVKRWVTRHGFALNINNDLKYFSYIIPCGITDRGVTSMSRLLGHTIGMKDVISCVAGHLADVFNLEIREGLAGELADDC